LRSTKIFSSGAVETYTEKSGKALLMYRPIHRAVSADSPGAKSAADILPSEETPSIFTASRAYMTSGDPAEVDKIRSAIKPGIRKKVVVATEKHASKVESEYASEINNVKAANAEGGAEAQAKAAAEMQKIINLVKGNLSQARTYTLDLFS
jgi:hypothetical protein